MKSDKPAMASLRKKLKAYNIPEWGSTTGKQVLIHAKSSLWGNPSASNRYMN